MKLFKKMKDGGPLSTVTGYWLVEIKSLFSVVLLKFEDGSRDAYHSHAFNSLNWMWGEVDEERIVPTHDDVYRYPYVTKRTKMRSRLLPYFTSRDNIHKVTSKGTTWVLSLRGPWAETWREYVGGVWKTLTHGRVEVTE